MEPKQHHVLQKFAERVRKDYPRALVRAFGSTVKGTSTSESDLDVCVVIPQMQPDDRIAISDIAWEVGFAHDLHLSTIVISTQDFTHGPASVSPLLASIRTEGLAA